MVGGGGGAHHTQEATSDHAVRVRATAELNDPVKKMRVDFIEVLIDNWKGPAPSLVMVGGGGGAHHAQEAAARSHATAEMDALMTVAL